MTASDQNPYQPPHELSEPLSKIDTQQPPLTRLFWVGVAIFFGGIVLAILSALAGSSVRDARPYAATVGAFVTVALSLVLIGAALVACSCFGRMVTAIGRWLS